MITHGLALSLALLSGSSNSAHIDADLVVVAKIGDSYSYEINSKIEPVNADGEFTWNSVFRETLIKIDGKTLEWETTYLESEGFGTGVMQGAEEGVNALVGITMVSLQDKRGKVRALRFGDMEIPSKGSGNVLLPPSGAKLGDSWDGNLEISGQAVPIKYKLDSYKKFQEKDVAIIVGSFPEKSIATTVEPTTFWVERSNGKTMQASSVTIVSVGAFKMRVSYNLKRVKEKESNCDQPIARLKSGERE